MYELIKQLHKTPKPYVKNFQLWTGTKYRKIAEPEEPLKSQLKQENIKLLELYETELKKYNLENIPHAYRKKHNIKTNAKQHQYNNEIYKFDFSAFYDSVKWEYIKPYLNKVYSDISIYESDYKNCFINPITNGITQGSPCSGTLAGLILIPFWLELKKYLPNATITQYSDDLTISNTCLSKNDLEKIINLCLKKCHLDLIINPKKTKKQNTHFRKITGVSINQNNTLTCQRQDYRYYRSMLHSMETNGIDKTIQNCNINISQFLGKLEYLDYIDNTYKIRKLKQSYKAVLNQLKSKQKNGQ